MPKGGKEDRQHQHIVDTLVKKGMSKKKAEGVAWAVVKHRNKEKK